ncbi:MAG: tetratricopeptide repeat protein [Rhodomicrobiaceae bacterium]
MPLLGLMHLLIGIGFAYHAHQTGRPQFWMFILLFMPLVGPLAYVLIELVPEMLSGRGARKIASGVGNLVDPDREWRRRYSDALGTDSVQTKKELAEECERRNMWAEAIQLYETAAQGIFADDKSLLFRLARAQFGAGNAAACLTTLDKLRHAHPDLTDQEAHLLYTRALESQNRLTEAAVEYQALCGYYAGLEARTRYGLLLLRIGAPDQARTVFQDVVRAGTARRRLLIEADKQWLKVAKANL